MTSIDLAGGGSAIDMHTWNEKKFTEYFVHLVEHLPKLIALLVVLPGAPQSLCFEATATLEKKYMPRSPCFCVQITSDLKNNTTPKLPFCHYRALCADTPPIVGAMPFHL